MSQQHMKITDLKNASHHLTTLARWHHDQWSDYNKNETLEQRIERMAFYLGDSYIPSTFIAIDCDCDDDLLGSAAIVENDMDTKPELTPWLASVYVRADRRHQGIGRQIVENVMRVSYDQGIDNLYLFTPDSAGFYRRLGWEVVSNERYQKHDVTVMKADLAELF